MAKVKFERKINVGQYEHIVIGVEDEVSTQEDMDPEKRKAVIKRGLRNIAGEVNEEAERHTGRTFRQDVE